MINIIADSIDRLEDDVDFVEYFKSGQGLEHILFNLTDEDLERPELKEAIKKVFSIIPGAQSMEKKLGTRTLLKGIIKKFPEDLRVIDFIKVAAEIDLSYINEKIDNVSELKRVISSDKNPEEFINWLANEATALGIYWSFGDGFAYDADKSHPYRYTFVTNVSKDDVDVKRTQLASLKFNRNEQEIRLKQGTAIKLTQVLYDGSPLQLPPEVLEKTFYTSESDIEGSKMLHIEKLASSEDLELSRGEIGVSLEDYDPSKDKEKSTKNRWREKPNQNTAVKPALTQESDNYKKDKLDKAKYTNFLGRTDQDKPVRVMDFATPGQYVGLDDYFTKHTDTLQDDQQQYDTRNFGRGKMQPKQYSNFLYKSELLHIENLTKVADLNSKKPYLLQQLNKANITGEDAEKVIKEVNSADPTGDYATYTQWLLGQYLEGNFKGGEDVEKFKDTLNKFTKLKNSKKIEPADLNQYSSYSDLSSKVKEILDSTGGYTSNREEETTKAVEGIELLDKDGNIELYRVNTPEAASKEFRNTEWCVKDPKWFNQYAEDDPDFYYFKKDGKPYLLLHSEDFRDVNDGTPEQEAVEEILTLVARNNLFTLNPRLSYNVVANHLIKSDSTECEEAVDVIITDEEYCFELLANEILDENDPMYKLALKSYIDKGNAGRLISQNVIDYNHPLYEEVLNSAFEHDSAYGLIVNDKLCAEDVEKAVRYLIKTSCKVTTLDELTTLVVNKFISPDAPYYEEAVAELARFGESAYRALLREVITKDSPYFEQAVRVACRSGYMDSILSRNIATQEEVDKILGLERPEDEHLEVEDIDKILEEQENINKSQMLHITTLNKIAAESQDSSGTTSITPTVTDKVTESVTQKPVTPVTQGKGGKPTKGLKAGGTGTRPVKAFYLTNLNSIDIIADQFGDGVTRTELPESSVRRFRQEEANDRNKKEQDITRKKMKGKQNKPLHNVPKKDVYAWGNDDLMGGAVFYSDMSIPQMGDLSEME